MYGMNWISGNVEAMRLGFAKRSFLQPDAITPDEGIK